MARREVAELDLRDILEDWYRSAARKFSGRPLTSTLGDASAKLGQFLLVSPSTASIETSGSLSKIVARVHSQSYDKDPMARPVNVDRLQSNIAWAVAHGLGARDLIPMLERLIEHAAVGSDCRVAAERQLAELIVETAPWRAAVLTRDVLKHKDDDRAWALYGLAHTLLGNHRSARSAYMRALARSPGCASYAHNLGHLIDVAFEQPREALRWLKQAHGAAPAEEEIAASYAHALVRSEQVPQALAVLERVLKSRAQSEKLIARWLGRAGRSLPDAAR